MFVGSEVVTAVEYLWPCADRVLHLDSTFVKDGKMAIFHPLEESLLG